MRFLLNYVLPLLVPFLVYFSVVAFSKGRSQAWLEKTPWIPLLGIGIVLLAVSLVTWNLVAGSPPDERYIPPRFEDGRVVPGRTVAD